MNRKGLGKQRHFDAVGDGHKRKDKGSVGIWKMNGEDHAADLMPKPLGRDKRERHRNIGQ